MPNKVLKRQWKRLARQEETFIKNATNKKPSKLEDFLSEKIPDKLQNTLDIAFAKSFELIFDKGTSVIEKTYNKKELEHIYKVNNFAFSITPDKKRVRALDKGASKSEINNTIISGVKGVGLGFLGIGLPDIPIFMGMVFRGIYEIALQYGYNYELEEERYFILNIISTSLSHGEEAILGNNLLNNFVLNPALPDHYDIINEIDKVANVLSTELLYMKFVQGLPVIGAVGGIFDAVFMKKILSYARLKYKQRFFKLKIQQNKNLYLS
ncbi:hypothetical protein AN641_05275 [Candidatus Epulonipiscioides gigas]|nr:hypothetical protein AN641_05275 [Epulopiscium sp. SCG-C07WGA-EpuloA2]